MKKEVLSVVLSMYIEGESLRIGVGDVLSIDVVPVLLENTE